MFDIINVADTQQEEDWYKCRNFQDFVFPGVSPMFHQCFTNILQMINLTIVSDTLQEKDWYKTWIFQDYIFIVVSSMFNLTDISPIVHQYFFKCLISPLCRTPNKKEICTKVEFSKIMFSSIFH